MDPIEDFLGRRPGHLPLQDSLDVVGQALASSLRAADELSMEAIGDIPDLEHPGHGARIAHADRMRKETDSP